MYNNTPAPVSLSAAYSHFIRYDRLFEIVSQQFQSSNAKSVNLFIDMYSIIKPLYNINVAIEDPTIFTSIVLNIAGHLRWYFWSRHRVTTRIFITFTTNKIQLAQSLSYSSPFKSLYDDNRRIFFRMTEGLMLTPEREQLILQNTNLIKTIVQYLPDVYFILRSVEPALVIKSLLNEKSSIPNIILSKDLMCWQMSATHYNNFILRPRKTFNEDTSYFVNRDNVLSQWGYTVNRNPHLFDRYSKILPSEYLPLYIALTSYKDRNLTAYYSPSKALQILKELMSEAKLVCGYNSPTAIQSILSEYSKSVCGRSLYAVYG